MAKVWSLITVGSDRQYGGNAGYDDQLETVYRYDSNVPNHLRVAPGDLGILRDRTEALGLAVVRRIQERTGFKEILRCPVCSSTGLKKRRVKRPEWACKNGHQFDNPIRAQEAVRLYEARFDGSYQRIRVPIAASQLKAAALRPNDQQSIEELSALDVERLLRDDPDALEVMRTYLLLAPLRDDEGDTSDFTPSMTDQRTATLATIKARRGQQKFRRALIRRYGGRCAVTGCDIEALLEAAHIVPYMGEEYNDAGNGLLLRTDIHTLFDLNLIRIEPHSLTVEVDEAARRYEYAELHGRRLAISDGYGPSRSCLELKWAAKAIPALEVS